LLLFLDPGSGMGKIWIRDKHPGSGFFVWEGGLVVVDGWLSWRGWVAKLEGMGG
jgi:hypothetical protein